MTDHLLAVFTPEDSRGRDGEIHEEWQVTRSCSCGVATTTPAHRVPPRPANQEERELTVIWRATVRDGLLDMWQVIEDTPGQRALLGLIRD